MFWNSKELRAAQARIDALASENDDLSDTLANEQQLRSQAEVRARAMELHRDKAVMDLIAFNAASQIEDFFARPWDGVEQRKAAVQRLVLGLLKTQLTGTGEIAMVRVASDTLG